ncbi:conserved hypothetical protein [Lodderomyces elongisporus NRRL YB-4239]|uniref:FAD/NAD(P)-binding domain-containing protein n=1 Tax=Lodderomyces elongisporus (strain ATCC 11503 / CBS 2605 / JCM 1781 / NBRC 1676 / NRRL YB-4239) TaxID=379508 RepID=A5DT91_LODEL|nr:conserved hypothetical protein [Lodderomyces elongisporus NRRL YB-4239]
MSTITLTKESHKNPSKFRISYQDCKGILGEEETSRHNINEQLPTLYSSSKVAIIGAGFGGIGAAIKTQKDLKESDYVIFERHDNFGGTWYANTYPGCASDIPALWYSYSFALTTNWSRVQPPQYEMEEYMLRIVDQFKLREKAKFQIYIDKCVFDEDSGLWTLYAHNVKTGQKLEHKAKVLVGCAGGLVYPNELKSKGLETFKGDYIHSAIWNHSVDFKGKKVVVVGNGCSANQIVPALLNDPQYNVGSIVQIARSKHYIMPPVPKALYWLYRLLSFSYYGLLFVRWLVILIAEMRVPLFKGNGYLSRLLRWINTTASTRYVKRNAPKEIQDKLIPDYKIGCKRLILDYKYVPSLNDPRVEVTNEGIKEVVENGVVLTDGRFVPADIIVACTGYKVSKSFKLPVFNKNGESLANVWKDGASAYRTVLVKNLPNLFLIGGPNSATGHSSVVMAIENGIDYYTRVAKPVLQGKAKSVVVKPEAYDTWFTTIQKELRKSVFGTPFGGCVSWYSDGAVNSTAYAWSQLNYWYITHFPNYKDVIYQPARETKKKI